MRSPRRSSPTANVATPHHRTNGGVLKRAIVGATALAVALPAAVLAPASPATADDAPAYGAPDAIAADYYGALLRHTRWTDSVWDSTLGVYKFADFDFAVVLGNAVLVTHGDYDESLAGISQATLKARTVATIQYYAARNRFVNPTSGTWGKQLFWDSTFQSYFLDAGKLLWDDLDATTQASLKTIAAGQSAYTAGLNYGDDPMSGSWTPEWPVGRFERDTAAEESGVYSQALAPGIAWAEGDPSATAWEDQLNDWVRNAVAQPTADKNNPAVVGGKAISTNMLHNIYDTYVTENHNTVAPHYQSDLWRSGGRNAIQFILNDKPVPAIMKQQPNSAELWRSLQLMMTEQGEPFMSMNADREFLYGRDVIPLAFVGQVLRNPDAVRAEANMAASLEAYQAYAPVDRLAKFSGEPKYEPEARAEIAIAYLLHVAAAESDEGTVQPTPKDQYFANLAGVRDYGDEPGLTVQQSEKSWAAASSRQGYVKFPWAPEHNPWLFQTSGSTQFLYPSPGATIDGRSTAVYTGPRDGFEGTASLFQAGDSYAGQVTLPTGSAIYATSGVGREDGALTARNIDMGGFAGADGSRTYTTAEGSTTESLPETRAANPLDVSAARVDNLSFAPVDARYVRMKGIQGNATYGYSMYSFHVYGDDAASTVDLAAGKTATASSEDAASGKQAAKVTDASASTRWAVSTADRKKGDSWIQVDLGSAQTVGGVRLAWEASAGTQYLVQTSTDGSTWTDQTRYGPENAADANAARIDTVALTPTGGSEPAPVQARYVRMQGVQGAATYGYSMYNFRAYTTAGVDVAAGKPATASSAASGNAATTVTDGSSSTRWAVSTTDRLRADSWIQVDLGTPQDIAKVQLAWEAAAGRDYLIQTSLDGQTWTDSAHFRYTGDQITSTDQPWINVEGTAGFVVRDSAAAITVSRADAAHHVIRLADSPTTGSSPFLVEMLPTDAAGTAAEAAEPQPTVDASGVLASTLDGYLALFNLTGADVTTDVTLPYTGETVSLFAGAQKLGASSSTLTVTVPAGTSAVLAPRMTVARSAASVGEVVATVVDGQSLDLSSSEAVTLDVRNVQTAQTQTASITADKASEVRFAEATPFPVQDLALSTLTFPASVLPTGMTNPSLAVDGAATTSWVPGPDGRMVVDLGAAHQLGEVALAWDGTDVPDSVVSVSDDGLTFRDVGSPAGDATTRVIAVDENVRYVAVSTQWAAGSSGLAAFKVLPPGVHQDLAPGSIQGDLAAWTVGTPVTGALSASGTPSPEITVTAGALPAGVTLSASGELGGTPTTGGAFGFTVTATNGVGTPTTRTFTGVVGAQATTLALTAAVAGNTSGSLTATLEDGAGGILTAAAGTVAFYASSTPVGDPVKVADVVDGVATTHLTGLTPGTSTVYSAVYTPGDAGTYSASTSNHVTLTTGYDVVASTTTATVASVTVGSAPVAKVAVRAGAAAASGTVSVRVDSGVASTATLTNGAASVKLPSTLSAGIHSAVVSYLGNERTKPSSRTVTFWVLKATPVLSVSASSSTTYGKAGTVRARVTALGKAATGSVRVQVDGKTVATRSLVGGTVTVALPTTLTVGRHALRVSYLGSAVASTATASTTLKVAKATTKTSLKLSSSKATANKSKVKATVTVKVPGTSVDATGKVVIKVNGKTVKTVSLTGSKHGRVTVTLPRFAKTGSKVSVTATYVGSSNLRSSSAAAHIRVVR